MYKIATFISAIDIIKENISKMTGNQFHDQLDKFVKIFDIKKFIQITVLMPLIDTFCDSLSNFRKNMAKNSSKAGNSP